MLKYIRCLACGESDLLVNQIDMKETDSWMEWWLAHCEIMTATGWYHKGGILIKGRFIHIT